MNDPRQRVERLSRLRSRLSETNLIMGILNVTPDSFSDGGLHLGLESSVDRARQMIEEGADLIDVGGESTRPDADPVPAGIQMDRVLPVVEAIRRESEIPISVDTRSDRVARAAFEAGADIVNDISAMRDSPGMSQLVAKNAGGVVLMHMRGVPKTMQANTHYGDLVGEVAGFLSGGAEEALANGVLRENIWLDPGIGFGKSVEGNLEILREIGQFDRIGYPVVVGVSRKSFIGKTLGREVDARLPGTIAITAYLAVGGVHRIHRVHDVSAIRDTLDMVEAIEKGF
jgi:dihydropteroate synthase